MFDTEDTICAIASAAGQSQRGIVRISGPQAANCLVSLFPDSADMGALAGITDPTVIDITVKLAEFPPFSVRQSIITGVRVCIEACAIFVAAQFHKR